jgi:enoyl reductase-like protein
MPEPVSRRGTSAGHAPPQVSNRRDKSKGRCPGCTDQLRAYCELMTRQICLCFVLALSMGGGIAYAPPAAAQWLGPTLDAQRHDNLRRHQQRMREKHLQQRQAPSQQGLNERQRACAARYRTYNPRTDTYTVRPGVTARCRL